jgi:hypothetical protein
MKIADEGSGPIVRTLGFVCPQREPETRKEHSKKCKTAIALTL